MVAVVWWCQRIDMPPEVTQCHPSLVTPKTPLLSRLSPKSRLKRGRMKFTKTKLIPVLVFILCSASIFRFLNISMVANLSAALPPAALPPIHQHECSSNSSICRKNISHQPDPSRGGQKNISHPQATSKGRSKSRKHSSITEKEKRFLWEFFSRRVPWNLLVFGSEDQYSSIASLNAGGVAIFLDDYLHNTSTIKSTNNTQVHKIMYNTIASEAYQLLKDARENPDCSPKFDLPKALKCNLALSNLPQEVYDTRWDVVIVDGPSGGTPESPGRMASIYTASVLARRGNMTHVIVHDVDRMIEKWFSWEFLCEENLVSSKGRFWHFQILGVANATRFCTA